MTIKIRRILSVVGQVGIYACLCAGLSQGQASDKSRTISSASQKSSTIKLDLPRLVYPYYEWVSKDTALAWVKKSDGSVAALPLTGEHPAEKRISGASAKEFRDARAYGLKVSPDGSKILYLEGFRGSPAGGWRVGTLDGTSYTRGNLLFPQTPNLVWERNSQEWVSLEWIYIVGGNLSGSVTHYYIAGVTPPVKVSINWPSLEHEPLQRENADILGIRQDGIAVVPVRDHLSRTETADIYLVDIDKGRVLPGKHHVILPKDVYLWGMELSHSGDRIAWLFDSEIVRVTDGASKKDDVMDVWLSNSDGSDLKRLSGFTPYVRLRPLPGQEGNRVSVDFPIRWTIDDTAISYLQGDTLRLVKVK